MKIKVNRVGATFFSLAMVATAAQASDIGNPYHEVLKGLYPGKTYSPYAQRSFPNKIYW